MIFRLSKPEIPQTLTAVFTRKTGLMLLTGLLFFSLYCKYMGKPTEPRQPAPPPFSLNKKRQDMPIPPLPANDYHNEWQTIDSLETQGLFKSALEQTEVLATRAKADRNDVQVIKALIYRGKYAGYLEEDGFIKAVQQFENELKTARQPEKAILQSMLGELYATYLRNQAWKVQSRTPIPGGEGGDILTWSAAQIEQHALDLYSASVKEEAVLRNTPTGYLKDILSPARLDTVDAPLRPNLFDFLAHRAVEHFSNERSYLTQPAYKFEISQETAFAPATDFAKVNFESKDTSSGKLLAIRLYQKLLMAHQPNAASTAAGPAIDADLQRLAFVHTNATLENKDDLYEKALLALHKQYGDHPSDAEIVWKLASFYHEQVLPATGPRNNLRQALTLCEDAVKRHPNAYGAQWCNQLIREIRAANLNVQSEATSLPNKPALVSLAFKNVNKVWLKVVRIPEDPEWWQNLHADQQIPALNAIAPQQSRAWDLRNPGDFYEHNTELRLDPMPLGRYMVVVSNDQSFNPSNGYVAFCQFNVSSIAVMPFQEKGYSKFIVADRATGAPMAGVKADFYTRQYNSNLQKNERKHAGSATSDENGLLQKTFKEQEYGEVWFSKGADTLPGANYYNYRYYDNPQRHAIEFFTDRRIYRPGQVVYFKAITYARDNKRKPAILAGEKVAVHLYDVNGQLKSTLNLKSSEYGTISGSFTTPASGLTGQMHLMAEGWEGGAYFNVEEYKRPKFEVVMKPVEGAYRVNETITTRGEAKAYAGSNIDGAQVSYRVVRQARFPFFDFFWYRRMLPWNTESMEITSGMTTTGADGTFEVKFQAIPDLKIPKKEQPVFDYTINIDVTDINGETRSSTQTVSAGYISLEVNLDMGNEMNLDSLKHIGIKTTNFSGQPQSAAGEISLQPIIEPKQFFKNRYWLLPDIWTIPEAEYKRDFPDMTWKDEDNPAKWGKMDVRFSATFNTATDHSINLSGKGIAAGYYDVILKTKDAFGEPVEIKRVVRIWDPAKRATQFKEPAAIVERNTLEPGETTKVWLGGSQSLGTNLNVFFAIERNDQLQTPRWITVNGAESLTLSVDESDRGGVFAYWFTIRNNRVYQNGPISIMVPWSNKDLNIQYETFRDKLSPGQQEEWRLRITGPKKDKVAAEMVVAMYDASLDQFLPNNWGRIGYPTRYNQVRFENGIGFNYSYGEARFYNIEDVAPVIERVYHQLNWFNFPMYGGGRPGGRAYATADRMVMMSAKPMAAPAQAEAGMAMDGGNAAVGGGRLKAKKEESNFADTAPQAPPPPATGKSAGSPSPIRTNLNETVFFFPELHTDAEGNILVSFKMNEALTRWKFMAYAHTKDLKEAVSTREVVTQKELMVLANPPRFLRAGDQFEFSAKVSNLTKEVQEGRATLSLLDAVTLRPVEKEFGLDASNRTVPFSTQAGQSAPLRWRIKVPVDFTGAVTWQVFADGKQYRDGEESTIPVVTNRMLVTETMPITVRGGQSKSFTFDNLKAAHSNTLVTQRYTLEFTSNPAWYVVQSLPYLMEFPHECSEQIFSRFYANTLASSVTQKMPNIRRVYERWKGTDAMKSNLSKNQELKYALLEETPWVAEAQSEEQQRQNIALLFDLNRMADEQTRALNTLAERQAASGGWPWFPGGREDWYITQYIAEGLGHLNRLGAFNAVKDQRTEAMLDKALGYCDRKVEVQYNELEKLVQAGKAKWEDDHLDGMIIHYLYTRSFFPVDKPSKAYAYYLGQAQQYWLKKGLYQEGMIALILKRSAPNGTSDVARNIVNSLRERSMDKDELGMFWPSDWGYYWYQMPIETQALMVELFDEVAADAKAVEELRIWLLKNKQTNRWSTTKATAEAAYALLLHGSNWLENSKTVSVEIGGRNLKPAEVEPGTGYFKQQWSGADVKPAWGDVKVANPNSNIVWGAAYWQYFEDLDKISTFQKTPLTIVKTLYKEENSPTGPKLTPIADNGGLKVGDKVKVRIEIRVDRQMEYVHLKDMRAAGFEPVNVLSGYRWQGGLGYYESTKDLATHFFIDYLPKGTYVFEYPLVVSNRGDMSNGVTTIQCMYAPEFTSHSQGIRVRVE